MEQLSLSVNGPNSAQDIFSTFLFPAFRQIVDENNLDLSLLSFRPEDGASAYSSIQFGTNVLCRIRYGGKQRYLGLPRRFSNLLPEGTSTKVASSDKDYVRVPFKNPDELLLYRDCLCRALQEIINAIPKSFDCCSRFKQCSDARRCIHPDKSIAINCGYRSILASGRIFYGENRNID